MPSEEKKYRQWIYFRWVLLRLLLAVFDALAVNVSIVAALYTRFYVANEFHNTAPVYFSAYREYAPYYTVFCLVIFFLFRLYSSRWKYAGLHDLNRVLTANVLCIAGHVAGTLLFFTRMPISVYCISGMLQICLIAASRFTYRLLVLEKEQQGTADPGDRLNVIVAGIGMTAKMALSQLERDKNLNAVCVAELSDSGFTGTMDGLPVVCGADGIRSAVVKYNAKAVLLADPELPQARRNELRKLCEELGIDSYEYSGLTQSLGGPLTQRMLEYAVRGPVKILVGGKSYFFEDIRHSLAEEEGEYKIASLSAENGVLVIGLENRDRKQLNDLNEDWVKEQETKTGEEISFF